MVPNMINKVVRFRRLIYLPNETEKYAENELFVQQAAWLKYDKKKKLLRAYYFSTKVDAAMSRVTVAHIMSTILTSFLTFLLQDLIFFTQIFSYNQL